MLRKLPQAKNYYDVGHDEFDKKIPFSEGRTELFLHIMGKGLVFKPARDEASTHYSLFGAEPNRGTKIKGRLDNTKKEVMVYFHGGNEGERFLEKNLKTIQSKYRNYDIYVMMRDHAGTTFLYEQTLKSSKNIELNEEQIKFIRPARNFGKGYFRITVYANAKETKMFRELMKGYDITPSKFHNDDKRFNIDNIYDFQTGGNGFEFVMHGTLASVKKQSKEFLNSIKADMNFNLTEAKDAWDLMSDAGQALYHWIDNDGNTYKRRVFPTQKKLLNMLLDGKYDKKKAHQMFEKIVQESIKVLAKSGEFDDYYTIDQLKKEASLVAAEFRDQFEVEADLGNYDSNDFLELRNRGKSAKGMLKSKR